MAGAEAAPAGRLSDSDLDPRLLDDHDLALLRHLVVYGPTRQQNLAAIYAKLLELPGEEVVSTLHRLNDRGSKGRWVQHGLRHSKTGTPYRTWWVRRAARRDVEQLFPDIGR